MSLSQHMSSIVRNRGTFKAVIHDETYTIRSIIRLSGIVDLAVTHHSGVLWWKKKRVVFGSYQLYRNRKPLNSTGLQNFGWTNVFVKVNDVQVSQNGYEHDINIALLNSALAEVVVFDESQGKTTMDPSTWPESEQTMVPWFVDETSVPSDLDLETIEAEAEAEAEAFSSQRLTECDPDRCTKDTCCTDVDGIAPIPFAVVEEYTPEPTSRSRSSKNTTTDQNTWDEYVGHRKSQDDHHTPSYSIPATSSFTSSRDDDSCRRPSSSNDTHHSSSNDSYDSGSSGGCGGD